MLDLDVDVEIEKRKGENCSRGSLGGGLDRGGQVEVRNVKGPRRRRFREGERNGDHNDDDDREKRAIKMMGLLSNSAWTAKVTMGERSRKQEGSNPTPSLAEHVQLISVRSCRDFWKCQFRRPGRSCPHPDPYSPRGFSLYKFARTPSLFPRCIRK